MIILKTMLVPSILKKVLLLTFLLITTTFQSFAQKVSISESTENIEGVSRSGMFTDLTLDFKVVEKAWERHLKTYGKILTSNSHYYIASAGIYEITGKQVSVYSMLKSTIRGAHIWWAIDLGDGYASSNSNNSAYQQASKILHDFATECYKNDVNEQIKSAEKAVALSEKNYEREVKHGEHIARSIEKNKSDKIRLEELLQKNKEELEQLKKDAENNITTQSQASQETEKMKRGLAVVKEKINLIQ